MTFSRLPLVLAFLAAALVVHAQPAQEFALHDGDRVVFYGDSITQDGAYGRLVEEYARTRFPAWHLKFYNAGVGGDRVDGGGAGPIDVRLKRDLFALNPTVVTIMLGMNDGSYRASDPAIRKHFADGYRAIVDAIQKEFPSARVYPILPSPFDDIAQPPQFKGGYDHVLRELGTEVSAIAADHHLETIDFGTPLSDGVARVMAKDPALARMLLPDRVHPTPAGHLVLGAALLRAWHAPTLVSRVEFDAPALESAKAGVDPRSISSVSVVERVKVSDQRALATGYSWTELEDSLPLPVNFDDASIGLAQLAGAGLDELGRELLKITRLAPGRYSLRIDDRDIAVFTAEELARGINLALYNTPMRGQAFQVLWGSDGGHEVQLVRRDLMAHGPKTDSAGATAQALAAWDDAGQEARSKLAQPVPHHFTLMRVP